MRTRALLVVVVCAAGTLMLGGKAKPPTETEVNNDIIAGFVDALPSNGLRENGLESVRIAVAHVCDIDAPVNLGGGAANSYCTIPTPNQYVVLANDGPFNSTVQITWPDGQWTNPKAASLTLPDVEIDPDPWKINVVDYSNDTGQTVLEGINRINARIPSGPGRAAPYIEIQQWLRAGPIGGPSANNASNLSLGQITVRALTCQGQTSLSNAFADLEVAYLVSNARDTASDDGFAGIGVTILNQSQLSTANDFYYSGAIYPIASIEAQQNRTDTVIWRVTNRTEESDAQLRRIHVCVGLGLSDISPENNCGQLAQFRVRDLCQTLGG